MTQSSLAKKVLKLPSTLDQIRKSSDEILKALGSFSVDETVLFNIKLCIEEAVRNAIVHGNKKKEGLGIEVSYWIKDNSLNIEVGDEGKGFDVKKLPDPTKDENLLREHGRGVFLINHLMDEVIYNERGNKVRMIKTLSGGKDGA
ncbi:ATP-binding protein [Candidatus Omnitrophota bacterium]